LSASIVRDETEVTGIGRKAFPDLGVVYNDGELGGGEVLLEERQRLTEAGGGGRQDPVQSKLVGDSTDGLAGAIVADIGAQVRDRRGERPLGRPWCGGRGYW
jgi:hypothetical protein